MAVIFRAPGRCRGQQGYQERRGQLAFQSVPKISCLNSLAAEIVPYPAAAKGIKEEAFLLRASTPPPGLRAQPSPPAVLRALCRRWPVKGDREGFAGPGNPTAAAAQWAGPARAPWFFCPRLLGSSESHCAPRFLNDLVTHE